MAEVLACATPGSCGFADPAARVKSSGPSQPEGAKPSSPCPSRSKQFTRGQSELYTKLRSNSLCAIPTTGKSCRALRPIISACWHH